MSRHRLRALATLFALVIFATAANAQRATTTPTAPDPAKPKIRAITAFVNLDRNKYQQQIADAMKTLKYVRTILESRGYTVQGVRIATQPFSEYTKGLSTEQAVEFFRNYENLAAQLQFIPDIGPAMLNANDPESQADVLAEILAGTKSINASLVVAADDGIRWRAVGAAARVIKRLEDTEHSQANFRFAAIAMVAPLTPFYPAAYISGFGHQFAIGLESANTVAAVFKDSQDLNAARQKLTDTLAKTAFDIESLAQRADRDTGWAYVGMDLSPAPAKDVSIGAALEDLTQQPFGSSGTLTAAATVTAAIRDIHVKRTGYNGLMIPILEDERLAQRWSEGNISIDGLLSYSAVCGTGLDTVPLPGDTTEQQLDLIIGDMASLAFKWKKPLSARLLPVANKVAGDTTDFDDPALVNATIQPLTHR
ncbi:MAG TPA: DUF711 family protein [Candidatus Eremiobacteraceae bacterium]|jgi:uncharacterized protein|nr:DUF711 family protein [Candidatus Eremiobacteraceae bacterium]